MTSETGVFFLIKAVQMIYDVKYVTHYMIQQLTLQNMKMSKLTYGNI